MASPKESKQGKFDKKEYDSYVSGVKHNLNKGKVGAIKNYSMKDMYACKELLK